MARFAEHLARFLGTGRYPVIQTVVLAVWIGLNLPAIHWKFDGYPLILLNLVFSAQAAYAAPLILLAQNGQNGRDRAALAQDRARATQAQADTEYLARELVSLQITVGDKATADYLGTEVNRLARRLTGPHQPRPASTTGPPGKARLGRPRRKGVY